MWSIQPEIWFWFLYSSARYMTGFGKTDLMEVIVVSTYEPKYTLDQLTMVFQIITTMKYYPLPSSWHWSDTNMSLHLSKWSISFRPLILPLIVCSGEMLTWCQCYYGNDSSLTFVSVLRLACSHDQTALQLAIDATALFQEDGRIAVNRQQTVQHIL